MTWPTGNVSVANLDAATDSISSARSDLYDAVTKLNQIIDNGAGGDVVLDTTPQLGGNLDVQGYTLFSSTTGNVTIGSGSRIVLNNYVEPPYSGGNTGSTVSPDYANGVVQKFTANVNFTLNAPTNMTAGSSLSFIITQDATGGRTMTANSSYKFAGGSKTLSTAGNSIDVIHVYYDGTNHLSVLTKAYS